MERDAKTKGSKVTDVAAFLSQRWAWLGALVLGRRTVGDVDIQGFSCNFSGTRWLVVVRGLRVADFTNVVAFGSGETLYDALRNATTSVSKAQWKRDQFRQAI